MRGSSDVLAAIRQRQAAVESSSAEPGLAEAETLAARIVSFLETAPGKQAPSAQIVAAFQGELAANQTALFKSVLKQVATKVRGGSGVVWQVKPEFAS